MFVEMKRIELSGKEKRPGLQRSKLCGEQALELGFGGCTWVRGKHQPGAAGAGESRQG